MRTGVMNGEYEPKEQRETKSERIETELKYRLTNLDVLGDIIGDTEPVRIHQLYLSQPEESSTLRLRRQEDKHGNASYEACLKSSGNLTEQGLSRLESTVEISAETFDLFLAEQPAELHKTRYEPVPGVSVDLIDGIAEPQVEIEDIFINQDAYELFNAFKDVLRDVTDDPEGDNETLAYRLSGRSTSGEHQRDTNQLFQEILTRFQFHPPGKSFIVTLTGRSGSGKSTTARELEALFGTYYPAISVSTISTDDYHRGKRRIEAELGRPCTNWDEATVYDTDLLAFDLWELAQGKSVDQRSFSFRSQEVEVVGTREPTNIVIVEGIVAQSPDLDGARNFHVDVGTPLATCLSRDMARIRQDTRGNGGIGDQLDRMRYIIEVAEPTYRHQERHMRTPFSASTRPV